MPNNQKTLELFSKFVKNAEMVGEITYVCGRCNTIFSNSENLADVETEKDLCPNSCGNDSVEVLGEDADEAVEILKEYLDLESNTIIISESEFGSYLNIEHL